MAGSTVTSTTPTNFTYPERTPKAKGSPPVSKKEGTPGALSPKNKKRALIFPLVTAALSATLTFAGRSDKQRIFGAVTCVTLLGEAAFAYMIRNKKVTQNDNHGWPEAITGGAFLAPLAGAILAGAAHLRPNNALTVKQIVPKAAAIVLTELALKGILNSSKVKMRTEKIQIIGRGLKFAATAAYTGFLVRTR